METRELIQKLKSELPGSVLQIQAFGRAKEPTLWVEMRSLPEVAIFLKDQSGLSLDWLEHLSVMEVEQALVLTYFLRSTQDTAQAAILLRCSIVPSSAEALIEVPSVSLVWAMAVPMERELSELFGIHFRGSTEKAGTEHGTMLPEGWIGYPLRKSYVFPTEYKGIPHIRPVGQTGPDEYGTGL